MNGKQQTRYFHGVIVPAFARRYHLSLMAARGLLLLRFVPVDVIDFNGYTRTIPASWSALSVAERSALIDTCLHFAAERGIEIGARETEPV